MSNRLLLLGLLGFALATRLISLPAVDAGGDAILRWYQAKILLGLVPGEWEWSHHTARLGIMLPILGVQALFGTHPALYYAPAVAFSLLQAALSFQLGSRLHGRVLGVALSLFVVLFPAMRMGGAQLLPGVFSSSYVLAALVCLLAYRDSDGDSEGGLMASPSLWLGLSALLLFAAYLTKLSNCFWVPGFYAAAWLWRKRWQDFAVYAGLLSALVACETALYAGFTEFDLGRISMVLGTRPPMQPLDSVLGLLERYAQLPGPWLALLIAYAGASLLLAVEAVRQRLDIRTLGVLLVPASFVLGLTVSIRSLDPLIPAQPYNARYFIAALPLLALVVGLGVVRISAIARTAGIAPFGLRLPRWCRGPVAFGLVLVAGLAWQAARWFPGLDSHPIARLDDYRDSVADFEAGVPVLGTDPRGLGVRTWLMLYWRGPLPAVRQARFAEGGMWYAVADEAAGLQDGEALLARAIRLDASDSYDFELLRGNVDLPDAPP